MVELIDFKWQQVQTPSMMPRTCKCFTKGNLSVLVDQEPSGWHMSIAHTTRYPTWDEIKDARYRFCPEEIDMVMHLPPKSEFVNVHHNCFHLFELKR